MIYVPDERGLLERIKKSMKYRAARRRQFAFAIAHPVFRTGLIDLSFAPSSFSAVRSS